MSLLKRKRNNRPSRKFTWKDDTANKQGVEVNGTKVTVRNPAREMTVDDALLHAAYIFALADMTANGDKFTNILARISERLDHERGR